MTTASMVTIARCAPGDCQAVAQLGRKVWQEWGNGMPLSRQLLDLGHPVFIAKNASGDVIAYGIGIKEAFGPAGWILSITVDANHRRMGIGKKLLAAILDVFRSNSVSKIGAIVAETNYASKHMFRSFGFVQKETMDDYYPPEIVHRFELVF